MRSRATVLNTFERKEYGRFVAIYSGVLGLLSLAWLAAFARTWDQLLPAAAIALVFGATAWRARTTCEIVQSVDEVRVREVSWTHRLRKDRVGRFTVETGWIQPRAARRGGSFLVAELKDGGLRAFREFSARVADDAGQAEIQRAAASLNAAWHLR